MQWTLTIDGQRSITPSTSYLPPSLSSIASISDLTMGGLAVVPGAASNALNPNHVYSFALTGANLGQANSAQGSVFFGTNASLDLMTSVTYGPNGNDYVANFSHVDDGNVWVTVGPASGVNCFFVITVATQTTTTTGMGPLFSFAVPMIQWLTPNHGPTLSPASNPTTITMAVLNAPLLDPQSSVLVQIGVSPKWATVPALVPQGADNIAANTNDDGSVNITFPLPLAFGGQDLGVRVVVQSTITGALLTASPVNNASLFSYDPPVITSMFMMPVNFTSVPGAGMNPQSSTGPYTCPGWSAATPLWSCNPLMQMNQIVILGYNFGRNPASAGLSSIPDLLTRILLLQPSSGGAVVTPPSASPSGSPSVNSTASNSPGPSSAPMPTPSPSAGGGALTPASWVPSSSGSETSTVFYWSNSRIVVFTYAAAGSLQVQLQNIDEVGALESIGSPITPFAQIGPTVTSVSGATTNVPGTGGTQLSLSVQLREIDAGSVPTVSVGGFPCTGLTAVPVPVSNGQTVLTCTVPPGQGSHNVVLVNTTYAGSTGSALAPVSIAYAPPVATAFVVIQPNKPGGWVVYNISSTSAAVTVFAPTLGGDIQVWGSNLGIAPSLVLASEGGATIVMTTVMQCTPTNGVTAVPPPVSALACWEFEIPPGQGSGQAHGSANFTLTLVTSNQSTAPAYFSYNAPTVTGVTATDSSSGAVLATVPLSGWTSAGSPVTLTLTGYDFGTNMYNDNGLFAENYGVYVSFFRPNDVGGYATAFACGSPVRFNDSIITCTLPPGSGAMLSVRVGLWGQPADPAWYSDSLPTRPALTYDSPTITSAYSLVRAVSLPVPPCVNVTTLIYNNTLDAYVSVVSVCQQPPPYTMNATSVSSSVMTAFAGPSSIVASLSQFGSIPWSTSSGGVTTLPGAPGVVLSASSFDTVPSSSNANATLNMTYVTITGNNFGSYSALSCVVLSWSSRAALPGWTLASPKPLCNGREDFLGEGELEAGRILAWNNTQVRSAPQL